jgi:hypothetical protein
MTDAQGTPAQSITATLPESPSATDDARRPYSGWLTRALATVGAFLLGYAIWLPWVIVSNNLANNKTSPLLIDPNAAFGLGYFKLGEFVPSPFVLAAFSVLGLLLAPLLWRPADSLLGAIASHMFGLWVVFATVLVVVFGISPIASGKPVVQEQGVNGDLLISSVTGHLTLGFWLAVVALVPLWIAVIGLLVSEWRRHAFWHLPGNDADAPRSLIQLPGASLLNLGLLIWAFGFLVTAWASLNCTQTPLLVGSCQGTSASGALSAGIAQATAGLVFGSATDPSILLALDPNVARDAIGILLGGGALLIFLGVWLRAVTRTFCVWTTLWLLVAVALVGVAYNGVGAIVANPTHYGLPAGVWQGASGVLITLVGLILAIAGLATLAFVALHRSEE